MVATRKTRNGAKSAATEEESKRGQSRGKSATKPQQPKTNNKRKPSEITKDSRETPKDKTVTKSTQKAKI